MFLPGTVFSQGTDSIATILPSALQYASMLKDGPYDPNRLNDPVKKDSYTSRFSKTMNAGIYYADMTNILLHDQTQDFLLYFKTTREIFQDMEVPFFDGPEHFMRLQLNLGNKDSLMNILADEKMLMDEYYETKADPFEAFLTNLGSWVETNYLYLNGSEKEKNKRIKEQHDNLLMMLTLYDTGLKKKDRPEYKELKERISEMKGLMDRKMTKDMALDFVGKLIALRVYLAGQ